MLQRQEPLFPRKEWAILATRDANWHKKYRFLFHLYYYTCSGWNMDKKTKRQEDIHNICQFLNAATSPSTYPWQWVGGQSFLQHCPWRPRQISGMVGDICLFIALWEGGLVGISASVFPLPLHILLPECIPAPYIALFARHRHLPHLFLLQAWILTPSLRAGHCTSSDLGAAKGLFLCVNNDISLVKE